MSIDRDREYYLLQQIMEAPGQRLGKFAGTKAKPRGLDLDGPAKKAVEARLIGGNLVVVNGKGKDKHFALTEAGRIHLGMLTPFPPPPPPPDPRLKAFILLNFLAAGDRHVTLKQLKAMLPAAVGKTLGASRESLMALLDILVRDFALEQSTAEGATADDRIVFRLTGNGKREIVHHRQHPDLVFRLSGAAINQLVELATGKSIPNESISHCITVPAVDQAQNLVALAAGASFSDEELIREAKSLMTSRGSNGLLPIFELRRHVKRKFGERAGEVEEFDKRLKRLRGERLDLISLFDTASFSHDQISEGVQGAGELFFYVRNLR